MTRTGPGGDLGPAPGHGRVLLGPGKAHARAHTHTHTHRPLLPPSFPRLLPSLSLLCSSVTACAAPLPVPKSAGDLVPLSSELSSERRAAARSRRPVLRLSRSLSLSPPAPSRFSSLFRSFRSLCPSLLFGAAARPCLLAGPLPLITSLHHVPASRPSRPGITSRHHSFSLPPPR